MTLLSHLVVAFVAYQFGRWVKRGDLTAANYADARTIAELRAKVAGFENPEKPQ